MKLISMTSFILAEGNPSNTDEQFADKVMAYANFLKQPLEIWMFVPCDEEGNVLEEPVYKEYCNCDELDEYDNKCVAYQQAKERCLFDGFELKYHHLSKQSICTIDNSFHIFWNTNDFWELSKGMFTIEDLVKYNLTLTQTAIKQLGL